MFIAYTTQDDLDNKYFLEDHRTHKHFKYWEMKNGILTIIIKSDDEGYNDFKRADKFITTNWDFIYNLNYRDAKTLINSMENMYRYSILCAAILEDLKFEYEE